uniref:carboxypeptidase-like regulatory domain-containing protein n=1 Tax=Chitinophaga sp. TaxID=1869181 RepID=UPI00260FABE1
MKKILLLALPALFLSIAASAQVNVKGLIRSKDGVPLPGATIGIKGTNSFAQADSLGRFTLETRRDPPFFVIASFIGYKTNEIQFTRQSGEGIE